MRFSNFRELQIWQKGISLSTEVYKLSRTFPDFEKYGLSSQIQRAAVSVPTNIAEGHGRSSNPDFVRFLYISLGSLQELETLLVISHQLGYVDDVSPWIEKVQEINKMVSSLIQKIKAEN